MFAEDFLFNGQKASDFGLVISSDNGGESVVSGGEIDIVSVRTPDSDTFDFYTGKLDSPIQFTFSVLKLKCNDPNDIYVTPEEESRIARWLMRKSKFTGYGWLQFDQDFYRDICYKVCFTVMQPIQVAGHTVGFELTCVSNCGYGFSNEKKHKFKLSNLTNKKIVLTSDMVTYVYPYISVKGGSGEFTFGVEEDTQQSLAHFTNITSDLILDSENDIINGIPSTKDFNWYFPRMIDGDNTFITSSTNELTVELTYREARRIMV